MARRLIVPPELLVEGEAGLPSDLAHYVAKVLRLTAGAPLRLLDGQGGAADATLASATKSAATVRIGPVERSPRPAPAIELLQAVGKGDKMDAVVRQATELGITRITPVLTARAVARQEKRVERWRTIADDAVRVADHRWRPEISPVRALPEALEAVHAGLRVVFALDGAAPLSSVLAASAPEAGIALLVGPEGGLTGEEVAAARARGFVAAHLGAHTLRTDTAGPAVTAIVGFWAGRFDGAA